MFHVNLQALNARINDHANYRRYKVTLATTNERDREALRAKALHGPILVERKGSVIELPSLCLTAAYWALNVPGLRDQGIATLAFWGAKITTSGGMVE